MKQTLIILLTVTTLITPPSFAVNHVLSLDDDGDYVEIADSESLNAINSQVTMEAWIKATAFTNKYMPIIYKGDEQTPNFSHRSYALWLRNDGVIHFTSASGGQRQMALYSQGGLIALDTWYHVTAVIGGYLDIQLYVNGISEGDYDDGTASSIAYSNNDLFIGSKGDGQRFFKGQFDDVRVYNRALTQAEVAELAGIGP